MPAVEPATPQGAEATAASATSPEPAPSDAGSTATCPTAGRGRGSSPRSSAGSRTSTASTSRASRDRGPGGRITKKDVLAAIDSGGAAAAPATAEVAGRRHPPRYRPPPPRHPRPAGLAPVAARGRGPGRRGRAHLAHPQADRAAHGRLAPDLRTRVDDGRGQHRPPREAAGAGEGGVQGQARRQPHLPPVRDPGDLRRAPHPSRGELGAPRGRDRPASLREHGHRGLLRRRAHRSGDQGSGRDEHGRARAGDRGPRGAGESPSAQARRDPGLDVHDHEPGPVRLDRERPDHQPAEHRDPVPRRDPEARRS